ncbi:transcription initiation factor TFIID subunit 12 [Nilaparvata lugens]|uniref:transcription initiation factor TFIID subunit 12 n=1 Tax=Nilaparvata lugens TaxID=108931 RepID=UPI000B980C29|nr:transcription initiation factor TFIID subunit 12 [Nilaparvata lugens]
MRSDMEASNGLFQQQNQTQMAVDNDITMFTQTTHIQPTNNNNIATNTTTQTLVNNNETPTQVVTTSVGGVAATLPTTSNMVVSHDVITPSRVAHDVITPSRVTHDVITPTRDVITPVSRLHSVLSNSSGTMTQTAAQTQAASSSSAHVKTNHTQASAPATVDPHSHTKILSKTRLQELVREVDATEQLDDDVEEILLQLADDFVETTVTAACLMAKHRKASTVEVKDVQLHLERNWNMWIPGFGTDELRPYKRSAVTEAHKQRLALIRKTLKKY